MGDTEESKLQLLLEWLKLNGVELRGCDIKYNNSNKGFGVYSSNAATDGVLLVVPLNLAITPMRVLQDPILGPVCSAMFEEGEVDDRFLIILFLTFESIRKNSSWKPYLDMLPTTFGIPLWFSEDELSELSGTTLFKATELQKKSLRSLYDDKVKELVKKLLILDGDLESEVCFNDFLWANSIFWTRALSIPLPRSFVFPQIQEEEHNHASSTELANELEVNTSSIQAETVWVEGLVPGIDFCNHDLKAAATWEVDGTGSATGVPLSMYLLSVEEARLKIGEEISISYGNKGNEELLYLYGFVTDSNPNDYIMVHYPAEAIKDAPFSQTKLQLLEAQKAEMRCLLSKKSLDHGFFSSEKETRDKVKETEVVNYSWSGQRKTPSYLNSLVFPDEFLTCLRTIAMSEDEIFWVSSLLEELVDSEGDRQPSDIEVRAAVWEACGDAGALQLLVDLLNTRMMDLEEGSGTEDSDTELLEKAVCYKNKTPEDGKSNGTNEASKNEEMSRNKYASIVYRRGQKQLTRQFLKEAEHALQLALSESN
ncbi:putative methyltransferase transcription regulator SET family [Helianthus annuus]|uniref:Methyltransferase transcription regulator SET family n=1 Tax=Helianthus annuus TaxID=4232 RepID=A0A251V1A4_HELAN|nr:ribulose-1,5 bisphosphate carboxylase/oxygenase large subunit N-methyltransferase, chloroplastic isoform X2 [Helianthus annuus]KAF5811680.1 putative methyltransferase transcription regulator SET family [Helianthus annuus]KAJ0598279.1 putative methyltransferase transcription regulator SET family [Helianthus annuus]